MGAFKSAVITAKGQALMAKAVAGTANIKFTRIVTSSNNYNGTDLAKLTSLTSIKQSALVASVTIQNASNVKVSTAFSNESLNTGYYIRAIGLYATDPQEGEILYSVSIADETTATADYMPPFNGIGVSSLLVDMVTAVSNASSVNVVVDPSAMATVAQVQNLQDQINTVEAFVGYNEDSIYGVEVDWANNRVTKIAGNEGKVAGTDYNSLKPWMRKRCNVADNGTVNAYYGDSGYKEDGSNGQVMVEQPVFYVKVVPLEMENATSGKGKQLKKARYYISDIPRVGFKAPRAFYDEKGVLQDKIYLSAYEGCIYDKSANDYVKNDAQVMDTSVDIFSSIAEAKPASGLTQNLTRASVRKMCNNRGAGWMSHNIYALAVTQWLVLVEYGTFNVQQAVGRGVCDLTDDGSTNMAYNTGATASLGNGSGNAEGGTNGKCSVTYRGEENLWGNIWTWLDALNIYAYNKNSVHLHNAGDTMADDTKSGYTEYEAYATHANGYYNRVGYDENYPELFIPTNGSGSESTKVSGNYVYQNNTYSGFFIARLGGSWDHGSVCGWFLFLTNASSYRIRNVGGRLLYVPQSA